MTWLEVRDLLTLTDRSSSRCPRSSGGGADADGYSKPDPPRIAPLSVSEQSWWESVHRLVRCRSHQPRDQCGRDRSRRHSGSDVPRRKFTADDARPTIRPACWRRGDLRPLFLFPSLLQLEKAQATTLTLPPHLTNMLQDGVQRDPAATLIFLAEGLKPSETGKRTSTAEMSSTGVWSQR